MEGWLKLYRAIIDKPIWNQSTPEQKAILITILCMVNYEEKEWEWQGQKYICKPGQVITSLEHIVKRAGKGISIQNVRTSLKRFENYGFLTDQSTNKNRLITVLNWELYQGDTVETNRQTNKQLTSNQQATNKQLTTTKEIKKYKNYKEIIYTEIENEILDHWNSKDITQSQKTEGLQKAIKAALKKFSREQIVQAIDNYSTVFKDQNYFYSHMWYLDKFLKQANGVPDFIDTGQKWVNYKSDKKKPSGGKAMPNANNFEQRNYEKDYLDSLYENS